MSDPTLVGVKQNMEWWKTFGQVEGFWEAAPEHLPSHDRFDKSWRRRLTRTKMRS